MQSTEIESQPLKEKLLPQVSIKFLFALMTACALLMVLFQASAGNAAFWTKIMVLVLTTVVASFVLYAVMFLLANLMAKTTQPLVDALESPSIRSSASASTELDAPFVDSDDTEQ